mmetsp:Transcript_3663/g.7000  ORF Transcript_3663/g.7000 Transcript_3663/m.7000 type:complete len:197 (+) Transcript_3663:518-1108(+)
MGYKTKRVRLKYAYPAATESGEIEKDKENFLLEEQGEKICYVFDQGSPSAQGPDVLVLVSHHTTDHELLIIQCKHYLHSPGPKAVRKWWKSLGIYFPEGVTSEWEPNQNGPHHDTDRVSASRSFAGINEFRKLLQEKLQMANGVERTHVYLGDRILACSFKTPRENAEFPVPKKPARPRSSLQKEQRARVWFREML